MKFWDSEAFEDILNDGPFTIDKAEMLYGPIRHFTFSRNDKLGLTLETVADEDAQTNEINLPPGTLRTNDSIVKLSCPPGTTAIARGIEPISYKILRKRHERRLIQRSLLNSVEITRRVGPRRNDT